MNCNGERLYYSRRIGRTPELAGIYGDTVPLAADDDHRRRKADRPISGRADGRRARRGDAERGKSGRHDVRAGDELHRRCARRRISGRATAPSARCSPAVNRETRSVVVAIPRLERVRRRPWISGTSSSRTATRSPDRSTRAACRAVARRCSASSRNGVHNYQRPDADLPLDPNRTVLTGDAEELKFGKIGGQHLMFETAYQRRSPGFEINDIGFLRRADQVSWNTWAGFFDRKQRNVLQPLPAEQQLVAVLDDRRAAARGARTTPTCTSTSRTTGACTSAARSASSARVYDDRAARGGPAVRQDRYIAPWMFINGRRSEGDRAVLHR